MTQETVPLATADYLLGRINALLLKASDTETRLQVQRHTIQRLEKENKELKDFLLEVEKLYGKPPKKRNPPVKKETVK